MSALVAYGSSDEHDSEAEGSGAGGVVDVTHAAQLAGIVVNTAPSVAPTLSVDAAISSDTKMLLYNVPAAILDAPTQGPSDPRSLTAGRAVRRNMHSGFVEAAALEDFHFENQRKTFDTLGYAMDPASQTLVGNMDKAAATNGATVAELTASGLAKGKGPARKRKREAFGDAQDVEGFRGPWRDFAADEQFTMTEEEKAELERQREEYRERKAKMKGVELEAAVAAVQEKSILHIKDALDYQGRSFMHAPTDTGTVLETDEAPDRCFLPKACVHTWAAAHTKGVTMMQFFPRTAHLLLTCGMDGKAKLFEVYGKRRLIRTYIGHDKAVRAIDFNHDGTRFLTCSYDKQVKLWDTETGECIRKFGTRAMPFCVRFNPHPHKSHQFLVGLQSKKVIQFDINSGAVVQEYDRHQSSINSITWVDRNRRFITTSDDKSIRAWEWDTPVEVKFIAEPTMHSMPAVAVHPSGKWMALQSMDNQIYVFSAMDRFRQNGKKQFGGHLVAGYACQPDFSPDGRYLISGDSEGKLVIWDWKSTKRLSKMRAHDAVTISSLWHPHEKSLVVTASWDGSIKIWQ